MALDIDSTKGSGTGPIHLSPTVTQRYYYYHYTMYNIVAGYTVDSTRVEEQSSHLNPTQPATVSTNRNRIDWQIGNVS